MAHIILMGGLEKISDLFGRPSEDSADMVATALALEGGAHFEALESIFLPDGLLYKRKGKLGLDESLIGRLTSEHGLDAIGAL